MGLLQHLDNFKVVWKTELRFPPRAQDIYDLTRGNIKEFLALVEQAFHGQLLTCYEKTPLDRQWNQENQGRGPFRLGETKHEADLSQIILVSEINDREDHIDIDPMGAVKFAFLRPARKKYSPKPSGVYVATSNSGSPNLWYDKKEIILATYYPPPKLRKL